MRREEHDPAIQRLAERGWLAATIVLPTAFNVFDERSFDPTKLFAFRSLALVWLFCGIVWLAGRPGAPAPRRPGDLTLRAPAPSTERGMARRGRYRYRNPLTACSDTKGWTTVIQTVRDPSAFAAVKIHVPTPVRRMGGGVAGLPAAVSLLLGSYLLSTALSVDPLVSLMGSFDRQQGLITLVSYLAGFAAVAAWMRTPVQRDRFASVLALASVPVSLYGLLQRAALDPIRWYDADQFFASRAASTLGQPVFLGGYLVLALPITVALLTDCRRRRALWSLVFGAQVLALLWTQSRGPLLGACGALVLLFVLLAVDRRDWRYIPLAGLAIAVTGALLVGLPDPVSSALGISRYAEIGETADGTGRIRLLFWEGTVSLLGASSIGRWLVGHGPETLAALFAHVYPAGLALYEGLDRPVDRSHNILLDGLIQTGVLGVVATWLVIASVLGRAIGQLLGIGVPRAAVAGSVVVLILTCGVIRLVGPQPALLLIVPGLGLLPLATLLSVLAASWVASGRWRVPGIGANLRSPGGDLSPLPPSPTRGTRAPPSRAGKG
ncbi:MAG: O-antigen ligase family protein, partial [Chloroflexi bacterium]|nr:O-antigen ligase family protein [Chloroflexota bacterium]